MALEFSAMHLIVGEKTASMSDFSPIVGEDSHRYLHGHSVYKVEIFSDSSTYWWSSFKYGDKTSYSEDVANLTLGIDEANPRSKDQVELSKQLFCLYDDKEKCLYISDAKKKSFIAHYLKSKIGKKVEIKNFYKSVDDFLKIIQSVESVKFTAKRNLFSIDAAVTKILPSPGDVYGLGMPEAFSLGSGPINLALDVIHSLH
ncbi:hypothetical protein [Pseudochelatococcus contaminans]|uniref:Uncharacterized protein n=1 Tax=Pseudochelatococcus contaminans TaxID=1538103 RepID=A0A7W6EFG9_9HYPH|nr:hypothetical protein [Pseudochelatococcus contaminans]MBB3808745.1 hypothetical protein [Pseudochelatococcus contaminans]